MPDLKISQLPAATTPLAGTELVPIVQSGTTDKVTVADLTAGRAVSASALTASSGNLEFSGTAQRITGDLNNATPVNSLMFQTSATNGASYVNVMPNGTASAAGFRAFASSSDPGNASIFQTRIALDNSQCALYSTITGTGTYLPMTFITGGSERMRIDTSGRMAIGTTSANTNTLLTVNGNIAVANPTRNVVSSNQIGVWTSDDPASNDRASIAFVTTVGASSSNSYIAFSTNNYGVSGGERMRIDSSGNVGIGVALSLSSGYGAGPGVNFANQSGLLWRNAAGTWNSTTAGGAITYFSDNNLYVDAKDSTSAIIFRVNGANERMRIASTGSIVAGVGALATTATDGFLYVPTCAGTPTGTPTAITGMAPIVVNTTNNKLYFYSGGAWRDAGP